MSGDIYDQVAGEVAAALGQESPEVQQAYRYLFARVAEDAGLLTLIGHEIRPAGERYVYQQTEDDGFYAVDRPRRVDRRR